MLGSGWRPAVDLFGETVAEVASTDLPGFPPSTVPGHAGGIRSIAAPGGRRVLAFVGRVHGYEGHAPGAVVHAVRTAHAAGCRPSCSPTPPAASARAWRWASPC